MFRSVHPAAASRPLDLLLALALLAAFSGVLVLLMFAGPLAAHPGGWPAAALVLVALPGSLALARWRQLGPIGAVAPAPRRGAVASRPRRRLRRGRRLRSALAAALIAPLPR